ncbi:hypothetical protein FOA52_014469 [Chlamydomonas sp. UWO 241]|nr:hypothetical protein FOA52_014469 [Chlamydomonas sp. UWO 241]
MAPPSELQIVDGCIAVLRFASADVMNPMLDPISDRVDGPIKNRQGHNFPKAEMTQPELARVLPKNVQYSVRYVIACVKGNAQTLRHELCHARYYTNEEYRAEGRTNRSDPDAYRSKGSNADGAQIAMSVFPAADARPGGPASGVPEDVPTLDPSFLWLAKVNRVWADVLTDKQRVYIAAFMGRLGYKEDVHVDEFQAYCLTEPANFFGIDVSDALEELQPLRALANS